MPEREYQAINCLRKGEVLDLGGIRVKMDVDENGGEKEIREGDLYIGERNTGPHLLIAREVKMGSVFPKENAYPYDIGECVKVVEAE